VKSIEIHTDGNIASEYIIALQRKNNIQTVSTLKLFLIYRKILTLEFVGTYLKRILVNLQNIDQ